MWSKISNCFGGGNVVGNNENGCCFGDAIEDEEIKVDLLEKQPQPHQDVYSKYFNNNNQNHHPQLKQNQQHLSLNLINANESDTIKDGWYPKLKLGSSVWVITDGTNLSSHSSLVLALLSESIVGLMTSAVQKGDTEIMVWSQVSGSTVYQDILTMTNLEVLGNTTCLQILANPDIKSHINGYILCDMFGFPESVNAATAASHVYGGVIVDKSLKSQVEGLGYKMLFDASTLCTVDAYNKFKDSISNDGLVLMTIGTVNNRAYAIANKWFVMNYCHIAGNTTRTNEKLFNMILQNLKPLSPVIGWESSIGESTFVSKVSQSGNIMLPFDWSWNTCVMSATDEKQPEMVAHNTSIDPRLIKFNSKDGMSVCSFVLSDGDNGQWMLNTFQSANYYTNNTACGFACSYGMPVSNLSQLSSYQITRLIKSQPNGCGISECGGGYYYVDDFGKDKNRDTLLANLSTLLSARMQKYNVKVMTLFAFDPVCDSSKAAYQAIISGNDKLIGLIVVQYDPYSGGQGKTMWFKNARGIFIPVVTIRYCIWNHGNFNKGNDGTPCYVSMKMNEQHIHASEDHGTSDASKLNKFSLNMIHAWSNFRDIGHMNDPIAENQVLPFLPSYSGVTPASWCVNRLLKNSFHVVNVEEFMWRIRMEFYPDQTQFEIANYKPEW